MSWGSRWLKKAFGIPEVRLGLVVTQRDYEAAIKEVEPDISKAGLPVPVVLWILDRFVASIGVEVKP